MASSGLADRLFVSGYTDGTIVEVDLATGATSVFASDLNAPEDGACDPARGAVLFAEPPLGSVRAWDLASAVPSEIIPLAGVVGAPEGLSIDPAGNLYMNTRGRGFGVSGAWRLEGALPANGVVQIVPPFTDHGEGTEIVPAGPRCGALLLVGNNRIYISDPPGAPVQPLIEDIPASVEATSVTCRSDGEIFVSVFGLSSASGVRRYDANGGFIEEYVPVASSPISQSYFLEFDSQGNLYVADFGSGTLWKVLPNRALIPFASLHDPLGVAMCLDPPRAPCGAPPTCDAGAPIVAPCASALAAPGVQVDGGDSRAANGGPLAFAWTTDCPGGSFDDPRSRRPRLTVPDADCTLACSARLSVTDAAGLMASCSTPVAVNDSLPPEVDGDPAFELALWPPNHGYVVFDIDALAMARDGCGVVTLAVTGCASDQWEDAPDAGPAEFANGDGHTIEDCVLSLDGSRFAVRAERLGSCGPGSARTYSLDIAATDACGNVTIARGRVVVSHDRSLRMPRSAGNALPPGAAPPFPYAHPTTYGDGCGPSGRPGRPRPPRWRR